MGELIKDHLGNVYPTKKKMCEAWGIKPDTFYNRIKYKGWDLEKALTTKDDSKIVCIGIDGEVFNSVKELCEKYGISRHIYDDRIKKGWPLERIIGAESLVGTPCQDHEGRHFKSIKEMCDFHGISRAKYQHRIDIGMSCEEALKNDDRSKTRIKVDYMGKEYNSFVKMCEAYGQNSSTVADRLERGWTLENALLGRRISLPNRSTSCEDHLGNIFPNQATMCRKYGIKYSVYKARKKRGWTLEEILTGITNHAKPNSKGCQDHLGNEFVSKVEMCKFWNITPDILKGRLADNWTLEEALTIPRKYSLGEYRVSKILFEYEQNGVIDGFFHDITIKKVFEYLGINQAYKKYLDHYEEALITNGIYVSRQKLSRFRFDFSLVKNKNVFAFIEFDGKQHFAFVDLFFKTFENFIIRHNADLSKELFAEHNAIPLLRIRYDQVQDEKLRYMIDDLINNPAKYINVHNTYLSNREYMSIFEGTINNEFKKTYLESIRD